MLATLAVISLFAVQPAASDVSLVPALTAPVAGSGGEMAPDSSGTVAYVLTASALNLGLGYLALMSALQYLFESDPYETTRVGALALGVTGVDWLVGQPFGVRPSFGAALVGTAAGALVIVAAAVLASGNGQAMSDLMGVAVIGGECLIPPIVTALAAKSF